MRVLVTRGVSEGAVCPHDLSAGDAGGATPLMLAVQAAVFAAAEGGCKLDAGLLRAVLREEQEKLARHAASCAAMPSSAAA